MKENFLGQGRKALCQGCASQRSGTDEQQSQIYQLWRYENAHAADRIGCRGCEFRSRLAPFSQPRLYVTVIRQ